MRNVTELARIGRKLRCRRIGWVAWTSLWQRHGVGSRHLPLWLELVVWLHPILVLGGRISLLVGRYRCGPIIIVVRLGLNWECLPGIGKVSLSRSSLIWQCLRHGHRIPGVVVLSGISVAGEVAGRRRINGGRVGLHLSLRSLGEVRCLLLVLVWLNGVASRAGWTRGYLLRLLIIVVIWSVGILTLLEVTCRVLGLGTIAWRRECLRIARDKRNWGVEIMDGSSVSWFDENAWPRICCASMLGRHFEPFHSLANL